MSWVRRHLALLPGRYLFQWGALAPAVGAMVVVWVTGPPSAMSIAVLFPFCYAMPHAVNRIIELDRDHRLDHLRLCGQPPARLLWSLLVATAGPWLMLGVVLLVIWFPAVQLTATGALVIASLWGASLTISLLALALARGESGPDPRLVAVGLATLILFATVLQNTMLAGLEQQAALAGKVRTTAVALLAVEAVLTIAFLPTVVRAIARPRFSVERAGGRMRVLGGWWHPAFGRSFDLCVMPALMIGAISIAGLLLLWFFLPAQSPPAPQDWVFLQFVAQAPMVVAAFVISNGARQDRESGRLELLRLSPSRPVATLLATAAGVLLPFLAATAAAHVIVRLIWGVAPDTRTMLLTSIVVAPVAAVEGWHRRWPLSYTLPALIFYAPRLASIRSWAPSADLLPLLLLASLPWVAAFRAYRRVDYPPLTGWPAVALATALTVTIVPGDWRTVVDTGIVCLLLVLAGFTVDPGSKRAADRYGPAVAGTIVLAVMMLASGRRPIDVLAVAPAPACAWWIGLRVHEAFSRRWATLISLGLAFLLASPFLSFTGLPEWVAPSTWTANAPEVARRVTMLHVASTTTFLVIAMLAELTYRASLSIRSRSPRTALRS